MTSFHCRKNLVFIAQILLSCACISVARAQVETPNATPQIVAPEIVAPEIVAPNTVAPLVAPRTPTPETVAPTPKTPTPNATPQIVAPPPTPPIAESQVENQTATANDSTLLRLKLRAGQAFRMTQTSQVKSVFVVPATSKRAAQKTESWSNDSVTTTLRVLDVAPNGDFRVRVIYENVSNEPINVVNGVRLKPVASVRKLADAMNRALRNQSLEMTLSPLGNVSDVRGLETFWRAMDAAFGAANLSPNERKTAAANVRNSFNENALRGLMERGGMTFPGHTIRLSEPWFADLKLRGALPFVVNVKRTLQSRDEQLLTIVESGDLKLADSQLSVANAQSRFRIAMQGTYTGTTSLDAISHFALSTRLTQRYSGTVSAIRNGAISQTSTLFGRVFIRTTSEEVL